MSLYQCEECGCKENTALGWYWRTKHPDPKYNDRNLCSACGPKDGFRQLGEWHGQFKRVFYPKGTMETGPDGNLREKK